MTTSELRSRARLPAGSLGLRLTLWYAATTFSLVTCVALVQYRALSRDLASEDDQLVRETLAAVMLAGAPPAHARRDGTDGNPVVRGLDAECHVLFGDGPATSLPRCDDFNGMPAGVQLRDWRGAGGQHWRIASTRVDGLSWAPGVRVVEILLNRWTDEQVLAGYRRELMLLLPIILLLSAGIGLLVARRGLAPLQTLADAVDHVSVTSLDRPMRLPDAPAEVARLTGAFDSMRERLHRAFDQLTQASTDLAHELRTPLHILRQQAEVALHQERTAVEYREILSSSLEEYGRLGRMVDDLLFLARMDDPRARLAPQTLDLTHELEDVVEYLGAVAAERSVVLVADTALADRGRHLQADRMLLRRALVNVTTNAIRHTPAWGRVTLSVRMEDASVSVIISDTGTGIPSHALDRVFDRYFRVREHANSSEQHVPGNVELSLAGEGAGLGLTIVQGIMHLHGGDAHIESFVGTGTTVTLRFPRSSSSVHP